MGYFRRKLDRGRAREAMLRLHDAALEQGEWELLGEDAPRAGARPRFLRFSIAEQHPWSGRRQGVFSAAYRLLEEGDPDPALVEALREELHWFGRHLPVPSLEVDAAIFLFRPDAGECTRRIWNLVHLLRAGGLPVEMQTVVKPGRVVYEDELQVAVVPWASEPEL